VWCSVYEVPLALKGLRLSLFNPPSGVVLVDSETEFNLTVVDGPSNVLYTMDFDDGVGATPYNESSMLRQTFSVPGEYIVTATANDTNTTVHIACTMAISRATDWDWPFLRPQYSRNCGRKLRKLQKLTEKFVRTYDFVEITERF